MAWREEERERGREKGRVRECVRQRTPGRSNAGWTDGYMCVCVCVCVCVTVTDVHPILRGTKSHLVLMPSHIYDLPCVDSDAYP